MEPHDAYSSSGPTYEQVANGNGQDHTCSILINMNGRSLSAIDEEQNYHVVESGGCEGVEGAGCDGVYSEASSPVFFCHSSPKHNKLSRQSH